MIPCYANNETLGGAAETITIPLSRHPKKAEVARVDSLPAYLPKESSSGDGGVTSVEPHQEHHHFNPLDCFSTPSLIHVENATKQVIVSQHKSFWQKKNYMRCKVLSNNNKTRRLSL